MIKEGAVVELDPGGCQLVVVNSDAIGAVSVQRDPSNVHSDASSVAEHLLRENSIGPMVCDPAWVRS